jgi:hypothetical protein
MIAAVTVSAASLGASLDHDYGPAIAVGTLGAGTWLLAMTWARPPSPAQARRRVRCCYVSGGARPGR